MAEEATKDLRHAKWKVFLLSHVISFQKDIKEARRKFDIPENGYEPAKTSRLRRTMLQILADLTDRTKADSDWEQMVHGAVSQFTPPASKYKSFEEVRYIHEIMDRYKIPISCQDCLEWYLVYNELNLNLVRSFSVSERETSNGRAVVQIALDSIPTKKEWLEIYERLRQHEGLRENIDFDSHLRDSAPADLEFDIAVVNATTSQKADVADTRFESDMDVAYELRSLKAVYIHAETNTELAKLAGLVKKRRQLARKDAERFFGEEIDF